MLECLDFIKKNKCASKIILACLTILGFLFYIYPQIFILIGSILNKYSDGIIALVAILGLFFGQSWLDTSRKKMKGKLDYDIARQYLKNALQLRDAIKIVRNPSISSGEIQDALQKNGFSVDDYSDKEKVDRSVYSLRWDKVQEAWTKFEEILLDAEVSFGDEAIDTQKGLDELIRKLRSVVWLFVNYKENIKEKDSDILYGTHDENDEFSKSINIEIEKIRGFLIKHL